MHGAVLSREDYVRYECGGDAPRYPKTTAEAVEELTDRGAAIDESYLRQLVFRGKVKPEKRNREHLWTAELIDALLDELARKNCLSPLSITLIVHKVSARQFWAEATRAHEQLRSEWGELAGDRFDPAAFVWTIEPRPPAQSKLTLTPSPATLARLEAIVRRDHDKPMVYDKAPVDAAT